MNIFNRIKLLFRTKEMGMVDEGYLYELKETYKSLLDSTTNQSCTKIDARCYFKHIPVRGMCCSWSDKVYTIADKCHKILYNYCKKRNYIDPKMSYNEYITGKWCSF